MTNTWPLTAIFVLLVILPQSVTPFFILRRLSSTETSYHDNPAISPLRIMNANPSLLGLTSRRTPDLPESFSPSAKRFSFSDSSLQAMNGRFPTLF